MCLARCVRASDGCAVHDPQPHLTARQLGVGAGLVAHRQVVRDDEITFSPLYMLMRNAEGRKKQARSYKQQGIAIQHTQGSHLSISGHIHV